MAATAALASSAAVYAIADRLAQPEGQWKKFDRRGWRALAFPDWQRG
jgi:hypothetical protein